jgi:hypothetical protein
MDRSVTRLILDDYRTIVATEPAADYASGMAVRPSGRIREPGAIELLAFAYALGVAGTLWDWREHLLGPGTQPPHLVIDLGGLLVISVLAFSGKIDLRSRSFIALYVLLVLVMLIAFGPFVLMMAAPRSCPDGQPDALDDVEWRPTCLSATGVTRQLECVALAI